MKSKPHYLVFEIEKNPRCCGSIIQYAQLLNKLVNNNNFNHLDNKNYNILDKQVIHE